MSRQFRKRAVDQRVLAVDFADQLNPGETVVASNARGSLSVAVADASGADMTAAMIDGAPAVVAGTSVAFMARAGAVGPLYYVTVVAPTSDAEILSDRIPLEVVP